MVKRKRTKPRGMADPDGELGKAASLGRESGVFAA
jgi:hypothetical protein